MSIHTIRELFAFGDWGNDRLLRCAVGLPDEQLDRSFEMGPGTLREVVRHIYGAERNWFERIKAPGYEAFPKATSLTSVLQVREAATSLAAARAAWLAGVDPADLDLAHTYSFSTGAAYTSRLDDILMHVCNHGAHHRAQAANMLRGLQAAAPKYGADYIFMYVESPAQPAPLLDLDGIRRYFAYGDWASLQVLDAALGLADEQLDRPFEMGLGSLRKTLIHIHDAGRWWLGNWRNGPGETFPAIEESMPPARLRDLFLQTVERREAFLAAGSAADLRQSVTALVRPGQTRTFPLGVTMLQVCCHGTHHRAQALNMLRRLGAKPPELDWIDWTLAMAN